MLDSDGDGVADSADQCPGTPAGTAVDASGCPVQSQPQPPPPSCSNSSPGTGTASARGQVYKDQGPLYPYLAGWCVELLDASGAVVATALSADTDLDGSGNNWVITGLPAGIYTACEVLQAGWTQTWPPSGPSCGSGLGYAADVSGGGGAEWIWFGNVPKP